MVLEQRMPLLCYNSEGTTINNNRIRNGNNNNCRTVVCTTNAQEWLIMRSSCIRVFVSFFEQTVFQQTLLVQVINYHR